MTNLQNKLNQLMYQKNTNPVEMEKKTGLSRNTIYSIIHGSSKNPSVATLKLIAKAFDIELQELLLNNTTEDLILNIPLLQDTCEKVIKELELIQHPCTIKYNNIFSFIKEMYEYSVQLGLDYGDENYIKYNIQKLYKSSNTSIQ
jgi:transcriptional regulator with XRE-family HTH domain